MLAKVYDEGYSKEITLILENGVIVKRYNYVEEGICRKYECVDLRNKGLLLPGFIDIHTHLRGLELSYKEDEESGTKAAAHGGITAVIDMPNTVPKIDRIHTLELKLSMLKMKSYVDYGLYIFPSNNENELVDMLNYEGVVGVKIFPQDIHSIPQVVKTLKELNIKYRRKRLIIIHAEHPLMLNECEAGHRYVCRPIESEVSVLNIVRQYAEPGVHIHITHVTNTLTLMLAKSYGFTVDTCPHYLYLDSNNEKEIGCASKVNPPLRSYSTRIALLDSIRMFDAISTDHAPHSVEEKTSRFDVCASGISSIDIIGSLMLNLVYKGVIDLDDVVSLLSKGPAKILGLYRWGCLYEGCIPSYTIVDLNSELYVDPQYFFSKAKLTPYKTMRLRGVVRATIVRGYIVYLDNNIVEKPKAMPITSYARGSHGVISR